MREESQALVRFVVGWAEDGISDNGLPRYREVVQIIKSVPPYTTLPPKEATQADFDEYPAPYQHFQKIEAARHLAPVEGGFPLVLWPVVGPAQLKALAARDIVTVEQLAKLRASDPDMPGEFRILVERANQMLALSSKLGKFEATIRDLEGQRDALTEQVKEMRSTISAQGALINTLKALPSAVQQVA